MLLEGSCRCAAVRFAVNSRHPYPYMRCYCSICRKAGGGGGYGINLGADAGTLRVRGKKSVRIFQARIDRGSGPRKSKHQRHFCGACGSHLWAFHPDWPELVHPVASAIDTPLPVPPSVVHIMLRYKAPWVTVKRRRGDQYFDEYPDTSIEDWHKQRGLEVD